jgi:hypothetical protein
MSTAVAYDIRIDQQAWHREPRHTKVTLRHTWVCTQVNCNGVNHVWQCSAH